MSAAHSPEFGTGDPQSPAETEPPTVPELPAVDTAPSEATETAMPVPFEADGDVWVIDPHFGRIPHRPTKSTWGDDVAKKAATGAFPIVPSEASKPVPTRLPGFHEQDPAEAIHAEEPAFLEAEHPVPDTEVITEEPRIDESSAQATGRHALSTEVETSPADDAPVAPTGTVEQEPELPAPLAAESQPAPQPAPAPQPVSPPQPAPAAPENKSTWPITIGTLGGRIAPATPTTGRHTLADFARLVQPRTAEAPATPVADAPPVHRPLPRRKPGANFTLDHVGTDTPVTTAIEVPAAPRYNLPQRGPGLYTRANRADFITGGIIDARRAAQKTIATAALAGVPIVSENYAAETASPSAGSEAGFPLPPPGSRFDQLVGSARAALRNVSLTPSILTAMFGEGVDAQGKAMYWPDGTSAI